VAMARKKASQGYVEEESNESEPVVEKKATKKKTEDSIKKGSFFVFV
jgi:hypothetical protein